MPGMNWPPHMPYWCVHSWWYALQTKRAHFSFSRWYCTLQGPTNAEGLSSFFFLDGGFDLSTNHHSLSFWNWGSSSCGNTRPCNQNAQSLGLLRLFTLCPYTSSPVSWVLWCTLPFSYSHNVIKCINAIHTHLNPSLPFGSTRMFICAMYAINA